MTFLVPVAIAITAVLGIAAALWAAFVVAQPDEWLLHIRNGRVLRSGVGIAIWRRPGDQAARFTSTLQRVGFRVEGLTLERLEVQVAGSLLWAVSPRPDAQFRAFSKLGITNLADPSTPSDHPRRHLLTGPQHRAFQQLLASIFQRHIATRSLEHLLNDQDAFVEQIRGELLELGEKLGIDMEEVQLLRVRPSDDETLGALTAPSEQAISEQARLVTLEAQERIKEREIRSAAELAKHEIEAKRAREAQQAEVELALEADRRRLLEARIEREGREHEAQLDRQRKEAEAKRDAITIVSEAEEQKSPEVREHELATLRIERFADAFGSLPMTEARWFSLGDSPLSTLSSLVAATGLGRVEDH